MGSGCSQSIQKMGKSAVVPQNDNTKYITVHENHVVPVAIKDLQLLKVNTNVTTNIHKNVSLTSNNNNNNIAFTSDNVPRQTVSMFNNLPSTSIHPNSILSTPKFIRRPQLQRSSSVDSANESNEIEENVNKKFFSVNRMFRSSQNLLNDKDVDCKQKGKSELSKFCHRLSGSVHSLFQSRPLSASDTNLSIRKKNNQVMTQQQLIDQDYCPSVIYNRKQRHSMDTMDKIGEKSLTFNRIKNNLFSRFARKQSNINSRKT